MDQLPMFQRIGPPAFKKDLTNTQKLCESFGNPHDSFRSIHIAGTNGKGSVAHMIASILTEAGLKTGLYTSPHYVDFRERIKIDGIWISEERVVDFVEHYISLNLDIKPSFFELSVAMAFDHFRNENVEIAIIETGLGGRLDSTNVLKPIFSLITNISLDHQQFLGNDIQSIAYEKAGIIKQDTPVIIGEHSDQSIEVFSKIAMERNAPLHNTGEIYSYDILSHSIHASVANIYRKGDLYIQELLIPLFSAYQWKNAITSINLIDIWNEHGYQPISTDNVRKGLQFLDKNSSYIFRTGVQQQHPLIVWDCSHNVAGIKVLMNELNSLRFSKLQIIFSIVKDKTPAEMLMLLPDSARFYFCAADIPRAMEAERLRMIGHECGRYGNAYQSCEAAFKAAKQNAEEKDLILVCGSVFTIGELMQKGLLGSIGLSASYYSPESSQRHLQP